jgi:hypothetical protein
MASIIDPAIEAAAHIVQLALTPVFLLSGVAALVNVFSTRLGRVSDQADALAKQSKDAPGHDLRLALLRWRSRALDCAVILAALAGGSTCGAALALFIGAVRGSAGASLLFWLFGVALVLTVLALAAFVLEMLLAARGVRHLLDRSRSSRSRLSETSDDAGDGPGGEGDGGAHGSAEVQSSSSLDER